MSFTLSSLCSPNLPHFPFQARHQFNVIIHATALFIFGKLVIITSSLTNRYYRFSNEYPDARFYKIDVDEVPDVAQELGIRAMPTFLLFKNGEKVGEIVGANPKALEAAIKGNL